MWEKGVYLETVYAGFALFSACPPHITCWCVWITVAFVDVDWNTASVHNSSFQWKLQRASNKSVSLLVVAGQNFLAAVSHLEISFSGERRGQRSWSWVCCMDEKWWSKPAMLYVYFFSRIWLLKLPYITGYQKWTSALVIFWNDISDCERLSTKR